MGVDDDVHVEWCAEKLLLSFPVDVVLEVGY